jgi:integrase
MPNSQGRRRRFGAVRELKSGQWQARYRGPDGLMRPADRTFDSKTDAEVWLTLKEAEIRKDDWINPDDGRVPFAKYAADWIDERPGLRPKTIQLYRYLLRCHLLPSLGLKAVADIKEAQVRRWRKGLLDAKVSEVTTAKAYRLLKAIMNTAVDDGLIRRNPCRIAGAAQEKSPERPVLTVAQVYALADAVGPRYRALVLLATFGSLRWGELAALRRSDVNLKAFTIRVERQLTEAVGGPVFGPPKSEAGIRTVPLPRVIAADLDLHLANIAQDGEDGLIFTGPTGLPLRHNNFNRRVWLGAVTKAGLEGVHVHDLRHAGNTFTADAGANLRELMARMGHSTTRAALIYLHSTDERQRTLADVVDQAARAALGQTSKNTKKPGRTRKPGGQSGTEVARNRKRAS